MVWKDVKLASDALSCYRAQQCLCFSVAEVEQCWMAYLAHKFAQVAGPALLCFNVVAYAVF